MNTHHFVLSLLLEPDYSLFVLDTVDAHRGALIVELVNEGCESELGPCHI